MISLHQPGRIHHVAPWQPRRGCWARDGGLDHPSRVQANLELGLLPALDDYSRDATEAVEARLHLVGGQFPEARLRTVLEVRL